MSATAAAAAHFVYQVVAFLRPQVLLSLLVGPGAGATNRFEVAENALFPLLEALGVHVLTSVAVLVAAHDSHRVVELIAADVPEVERVALEAVAGRHAASERLHVVDG